MNCRRLYFVSRILSILILFQCILGVKVCADVNQEGLKNKEFVVLIVPESLALQSKEFLLDIETSYFLFFENGSFDIDTLEREGAGTYINIGETFFTATWKSDDEVIVYRLEGLYLWPFIFGTGDLVEFEVEEGFLFFGFTEMID